MSSTYRQCAPPGAIQNACNAKLIEILPSVYKKIVTQSHTRYLCDKTGEKENAAQKRDPFDDVVATDI